MNSVFSGGEGVRMQSCTASCLNGRHNPSEWLLFCVVDVLEENQHAQLNWYCFQGNMAVRCVLFSLTWFQVVTEQRSGTMAVYLLPSSVCLMK